MSNIPNRLRHQITFLCLLLSGILGCGGTETSGVPVRVLIPGPLTMQDTAELELSLGKQKFQPIRPTKSDSSLIVDLPPGSTGELTVKLTLKDADGCVSRGQATVQVSPLATKVAEARIVIDSQSFPVCQLSLGVRGSGQVRVQSKAGQDVCKAEHGQANCTYQIRKGSEVTLLGQELAVDSDFESWNPGPDTAVPEIQQSTLIFARRTLRVSKPESWTAQFQERACRADGLCMPLGSEVKRPRDLLSPNGLWRVSAQGQVSGWIAGRWRDAAALAGDAVAIWGTKNNAWVVLQSGKIALYSAMGTAAPSMALLAVSGTIGRPEDTLLSYGGTDADIPPNMGTEFRAVSRQTLYRCTVKDCSAEPVLASRLRLLTEPGQLLTMYLDAKQKLVVAGQLPDTLSGHCRYESHLCTPGGCDSQEFPGAFCRAAHSLPLVRTQGMGSSFWALMVDRLYRIEGSQFASKRGDGFRPVAAAQGTDGATWLLSTGGGVFVSEHQGNGFDVKPVLGGEVGGSLRGLWIDSKGTTWVAGADGWLLACSREGMSARCERKTTPAQNWEVVHGDSDGNVWAVAMNKARVYCGKNNAPCMTQYSP